MIPIFWRGLGFIAPLLVLLGIIGPIAIGDMLNLSNAVAGVVIFVGAMLDAILIWFWGRALNQHGKRHTFYFIPMEYWAALPALFAIVMFISRLTSSQP
jgi:hypothetical protein